jgi:Flp pilus assembly protein protease CpaA
MSQGARTFLLWAALLAVNAAVLFAFANADEAAFALLWGAAGAVLVTGVGLLALGRRRDGGDDVRLVSDLSLSTGFLGLALVLLVLSALLGWWLTLIGAGLVACAVAGLVREWRERRRLEGRS